MRGFSKATFAGLTGRNSKDTSVVLHPKKSPQKKKERLKENPFQLHLKMEDMQGNHLHGKYVCFAPCDKNPAGIFHISHRCWEKENHRLKSEFWSNYNISPTQFSLK